MKNPIKILTIDEDSLISDIGKYSLLFTFLMSIASIFLFGLWGAVIFVTAAAVMLLNYIWLKEIVTILTNKAAGEKIESGRLIKFLFRYILLGLFLYAIMTIRRLVIAPLIIGLSVIVVGIFIATIKQTISKGRK